MKYADMLRKGIPTAGELGNICKRDTFDLNVSASLHGEQHNLRHGPATRGGTMRQHTRPAHQPVLMSTNVVQFRALTKMKGDIHMDDDSIEKNNDEFAWGRPRLRLDSSPSVDRTSISQGLTGRCNALDTWTL